VTPKTLKTYTWNHKVRNKALKSLITSLSHRIKLTEDQAIEIYKDFNLVGLECDGEIIGCAMNKRSEAHIAVEEEHRNKWFSKRLYKEFINPIINRYGSVKTKTTEDNLVGKDFITRLGYKEKGEWYVYSR